MTLTVLRKQYRPATSKDIQGIKYLLNRYAKEGLVLARSGADISKNLKNFIVYVNNDKKIKPKQLLGCVALRDYGIGLMEIRSLAVQPNTIGQGIGTILIKAALSLAEERHARSIFALTLRPNLFLRLGFKTVDKTFFPQKVWNDCRLCAKRNCCDETALFWEKSLCESQ